MLTATWNRRDLQGSSIQGVLLIVTYSRMPQSILGGVFQATETSAIGQELVKIGPMDDFFYFRVGFGHKFKSGRRAPRRFILLAYKAATTDA